MIASPDQVTLEMECARFASLHQVNRLGELVR